MVRLRNPRAMPRRCCRRPLMASVGLGGSGAVEEPVNESASCEVSGSAGGTDDGGGQA